VTGRSAIPDRGVRPEKPVRQFVIDGEAVALGGDGISDFIALPGRNLRRIDSHLTRNICGPQVFSIRQPNHEVNP